MLYVDSNIFIYLFENHPTYGVAVADLLSGDQHQELVSSTLVLVECLAQTKDISPDTFRAIPRLRLTAVDEQVAERAARLQRTTDLRIGDAIHLATALTCQADRFFTNDRQLAKAARPYIEVVSL